LITLSLTLCVLDAAPAFALDSGDIVIANLKGEVHLLVGGATRALRDGTLLEPPATLRTGHDGSVDLRQGATTVSVGPDTVLEFPALEKRGAPIDRIVQPSGSAFYDVGKRDGRKLRVLTPYLVGVVKGTQFNVVAQEASTTISLFEGLLEVRGADDRDVIDLHAGEIASRSRTDSDINVMKMTPGRPTASPAPSATPAPGADKSKDSSAPTSPPRPLPTQDESIGSEPLLAERDAVDLRPTAGTVTLATVPVVNVPNVTPVIETPPPVESTPAGTPSTPSTGSGGSAPPVDLGGSVSVGGSNVGAGAGAGASGSDGSLNASVGLGNEGSGGNSGSGNSGNNSNGNGNSGNSGNNGNSGQGNNGNGQGNDGVGPGANGQGNNAKDTADDLTTIVERLRAKSGKK
jgi:hypothetical protein